MARNIDILIEFIREQSWLSPTEKEVLVTRVDKEPDRDELDAAKEKLYGNGTQE